MGFRATGQPTTSIPFYFKWRKESKPYNKQSSNQDIHNNRGMTGSRVPLGREPRRIGVGTGDRVAIGTFRKGDRHLGLRRRRKTRRGRWRGKTSGVGFCDRHLEYRLNHLQEEISPPPRCYGRLEYDGNRRAVKGWKDVILLFIVFLCNRVDGVVWIGAVGNTSTRFHTRSLIGRYTY